MRTSASEHNVKRILIKFPLKDPRKSLNTRFIQLNLAERVALVGGLGGNIRDQSNRRDEY